jgi:hypothetical protein
LDGSRQWPPGLPFLVFLSGVMRSICDELWRRRGREAELVVFEDDVGANWFVLRRIKSAFSPPPRR